MLLRTVCVLPLMVAASFAMEPSHPNGIEKRVDYGRCTASTVPNGRVFCKFYGIAQMGHTTCSLSCNHGYTSGGGSIDCIIGQLAISEYCREIRCPSPPRVSNGVIHCGTSTLPKLDDVCYLRCNAGHKLGSSSSEVKCLSSETWSTPPVCVEKTCPLPPPVSHGRYNCTDRPQVIGTVCDLQCDSGYKLGTGVTCLDNEMWTAPASCSEHACPSPPPLSHGRYNCTDDPQVTGTVCGLRCDSGYKLGTGVTAVTCLDDETWTTPASCVEKRCLAPMVKNGHLNCTTTSVRTNTSCGLVCDPGFTPSFGIRDRICQSDETWSKPVTCVDTSPPVIINCPSSQTHFLKSNQAKINITWSEVKAVDSPKGDLVNVTLTSSLRPGSAHPAGNYSVQYDAKDDAGNKAYPCSFTVSIAKKTCPLPPPVSHGRYNCTDRPQVIGTVCDLQCDSGYKLGTGVTCLDNETWTAPASCSEHACASPPPVSHGRYNCTDDPQVIGTVCGLLCDSGYKLGTGVTAVTCLDDETWTTPASCIENRCLVPMVKNGHVNCSRTSVRINTSCGLTCDPGFTPSFGITDRICQSDETWSNPVTCVDTSPPVIINCPSSQTHFLKSNQAKINITWEEVKAMDSPKGDLVNVTLTSSLRPGRAYPAGNYLVQYDAKDDAGNKAYPCSFTVSIATCPSGSYIKVSNSKLDCVPCPTGTYQAHEGRLTCVPCPTGLITTSEGSDSSSSCRGRCGPGSYSTNGVVPCSLCPRGSYQSRPGSKQCDACPVGRVTKTEGGKGPEDCICPRGFFVMDILLSKTCTACPKGTYQDQENSHKCVYCTWGLSTSADGSVSKTDCRAPCLPGTSSSDGLQPCIPCPRGSYQSSPGQTNCDLCSKGHTTTATGALRSTDCTVAGV